MRITRRSFTGLGLAGLAPLGLGGWMSQPKLWPAVSNGRRYLQYDVFTDRPLAGNQLAVFSSRRASTSQRWRR